MQYGLQYSASIDVPRKEAETPIYFLRATKILYSAMYWLLISVYLHTLVWSLLSRKICVTDESGTFPTHSTRNSTRLEANRGLWECGKCLLFSKKNKIHAHKHLVEGWLETSERTETLAESGESTLARLASQNWRAYELSRSCKT